MHRPLFAASLLAVAVAVACSAAACSPAFKDRRTPSGEFCSDMAIIPAGQEPDREYHRLQPIQSDPKAKTEAERLESLRKVACNVGADAVIEAVNEEVRGDNASYQMISSGTAVIWLRHAGAGDAKPLMQSGPPRKPTPIGEPIAPPTPAPAPDTAQAPPADSSAASAAPAKSAKAPVGKVPAKAGKK